MGLTPRLVLAALLALLAGCAAVSPGAQPDAAPRPDLLPGRTAPCVPPGFPPVAEWQKGPAEPAVLITEVETPQLGVRALYRIGDQRVLAYWVGGALAALDPAPDDPDEPLWIDPGMTTPQGALRAVPAPTCRWERGAGRERRA